MRLPSLDRAHILALLDNFEAVFESGTNPQRKHLLHRLVKEVRVHGRLSVEVTYFVPQPGPGGSPVRTQPHMAPRVAQSTNQRLPLERVEFRVFHDPRARSGIYGTRSAGHSVRRSRADPGRLTTTGRADGAVRAATPWLTGTRVFPLADRGPTAATRRTFAP